MSLLVIACARCTVGNHPSDRYCRACGLPLGSAMPDAGAGRDALGPYEAPEPADPDVARALRDIVVRSGFDAAPAGHGWRLTVPLPQDRRQAVYVGQAGTDSEGHGLMGLVSVCGPANDRDAPLLLKINAHAVEGHFAIKVLRGEEYFVVTRTLVAESVFGLEIAGLIRRIAATADGLEDRLTRGRDIF